jgi:NAD(P)-dependent dehydrogenase (short-subunit alcohol dehydrogenase family)
MRSALITGASTGIGRATALRLAAAGWRVLAGVRRDADGEQLRAAGTGGRIEPLLLDVTDAGQIEAAAELVAAELGGGGLDGLVDNAGIGVPGPLETIPMDDLRRQLEVNLLGQVAVTKAMLPALRLAPGRIVLISSIGGRIAFPLNGPYHIAKFGIEAAGDVLRQELRPAGISVSIVEPGSIRTPIWERSDREIDSLLERAPRTAELYGRQVAAIRKTSRELGERGIPPERVAERIEHALSARRPRSRYLVGADAKFQARAKILIPDRLWDRIVARMIGF